MKTSDYGMHFESKIERENMKIKWWGQWNPNKWSYIRLREILSVQNPLRFWVRFVRISNEECFFCSCIMLNAKATKIGSLTNSAFTFVRYELSLEWIANSFNKSLWFWLSQSWNRGAGNRNFSGLGFLFDRPFGFKYFDNWSFTCAWMGEEDVTISRSQGCVGLRYSVNLFLYLDFHLRIL